jgi:hypothetical protein
MAKRRRRIWLARMAGHVYCCDGLPNTCSNLTLLQAAESEFHDAVLIEATDQVNEILRRVREQAPRGRHLALTDTSLGLLLVWAEAIDPPDDDANYVSAESDEAAIRGALGINGESAAA